MSSRFKIPAHVFFYSIALAPACLYAFYYNRNKPKDEDFEELLRERYSHNINNSSSKRAEMHQFVDAIKAGKSSEKMDEVLYAGKGKMKRQHRVDDRYYGKVEGVRVKDEAVSKKQQEKKPKKKEEENGSAVDDEAFSGKSKSFVALAIVGSTAAVLGMFLGDRRK
mmetsp:Transcript_4384/g.6316  ORF Transcript_4384/g.6316 Transcript_4384/m.6316 type:complete len:166 (+) Transcript_4384:120-617(+)|eukprot:CAMPEP_0194211624 /NCGR_PEP_ID=MMETSP0156-20130528/10714_1 /TAXON_ID=33649 /ORGANISM="Thalassionema nitzschioides, Strain L26-B" /LENGTH=165 /DNA_ID=CAMNT_0038939235 /DNA_START=72 /DNA_END=569 /DNA_ORIENTATION=+